ncbi:hypothetical protein [Bartonella sp. A05]|uniref:hypothetical protein n=1 Tax=Bartonella sp. A05 TaxID=2967261 RepID=UPI0022A95BF5|nr:hypothetical protein [Bartonella sp. A05]MCZ2204460.1 hypothetical protein [Bartonella sp. A05]
MTEDREFTTLNFVKDVFIRLGINIQVFLIFQRFKKSGALQNEPICGATHNNQHVHKIELKKRQYYYVPWLTHPLLDLDQGKSWQYIGFYKVEGDRSAKNEF